MRWRLFLASAVVVGFALFKAGAPLISLVLGIALAALMNARQLAKSPKPGTEFHSSN